MAITMGSAPVSDERSLVQFYPNDPEGGGLETVPLIRLEANRPRWRFIGTRLRAGRYRPGTRSFQAGQLQVALARTVTTWEQFLGRPLERWQSGLPLAVYPRVDYRTLPGARDGFNAFYDRESLQFFFDTHPETGEPVYTCESCDISCHEAGHAVLDALHPEFWDLPYAEVAAFHEGFADCSAMLVTLGDAAVRRAMLEETGGDLRRSNLVSRLAEQMGSALYDAYGPEVCAANALRDAVNDFAYSPPESLPGSGPASMLTREAHSFARVFAGAFYDLFAGLCGKLNGGAPPSEEMLDVARQEAGTLLAQGVLLVTPSARLYQGVAQAMLKADALRGGTYSEVLKSVFARRRLLS
jgi:hypothetical protein